jgi:hypothetical protein
LDLFESVAEALPDDPDAGGTAVLSRKELPRPPAHVATDRVVVYRGGSSYNTHFHVDGVVLFADKGVLRALGVLLLATVFHPSPAVVEVQLSNPSTEVTLLRTRSSGKVSEAGHDGLWVTPTDFTYVPYYPDRAPFTYELGKVPVAYLPSVILTNRRELQTGEDRADLDTLLIGDDPDGPIPGWEVLQGKLRLAELFLNAGLPGNERNEYDLESEFGTRGVAAWSHELRIRVPGSAGFASSGLPGG